LTSNFSKEEIKNILNDYKEIYDEKDKNGILIHPYGPHIFHTNSKKVFVGTPNVDLRPLPNGGYISIITRTEKVTH
jgi:hypothetical protein